MIPLYDCIDMIWFFKRRYNVFVSDYPLRGDIQPLDDLFVVPDNQMNQNIIMRFYLAFQSGVFDGRISREWG